MKYKVLFILYIISVISTNNLFAQEEKDDLSFSVESSAQTKYIDDGIIYNSGMIIQPAITASYKNFSVQIWSKYTANDVKADIKRNEIQFILWYDFEIDNFTISPAFTYFNFPGLEDDPATVEFNLAVDYSIDEYSFKLNFDKDIIEYKGALSALFVVGYEPELTKNISLSFNYGIGWANKTFNKYNADKEQQGFNYSLISSAFNYTIENIFKIYPFVEYYYLFDSDYRKPSDHFFNYGFGFSLGLST